MREFLGKDNKGYKYYRVPETHDDAVETNREFSRITYDYSSAKRGATVNEADIEQSSNYNENSGLIDMEGLYGSDYQKVNDMFKPH